jgi:glycerol kinase
VLAHKVTLGFTLNQEGVVCSLQVCSGVQRGFVMEKNYILVVDEGTTGLRSIVWDRKMKIVAQNYQKVESTYPGEGLVEQDPIEIFDKVVLSMRNAVKEAGIKAEEIAGIGLTNQRGTTTYWNKKTGLPYYNFLVWLDYRGLSAKEYFANDKVFGEKFPRTQKAIQIAGGNHISRTWALMEQHPEIKEKITGDDCAFGGIDSWLIFKLTGGKVFATTRSNAGTFLNDDAYVGEKKDWNYELFEYIGLKRSILPKIQSDVSDIGKITGDILGVEIPIYVSIADQQSALFGEGCLKPGDVKTTMGTGTFIDVNVGAKLPIVKSLLSPMVAWDINGEINYLLEGSSFTSGACLQWAKDKLKLFESFADADKMASEVSDSNGVYFIPAITGMDGIPFMNPAGRASFMGVEASADNRHFVRSIFEGLGFAAAHIFEYVKESIGDEIRRIVVDGGVSKSDLVLQTIADVTGATVCRTSLSEVTALGAASLVAIGMGWYKKEDVKGFLEIDKEFSPNSMNGKKVRAGYKMWLKAVERSKDWVI